MFKQNKIAKIVIVFITILIILGAGFLIFYKKYQQKPNNNQNNIIKLNSQIVEEKVVASKGEGFPRFIPQQGVELIIAPYQYTWDIEKQKLLESDGLLVFEYTLEHKIKKVDKISYNFCFECFVSFSEKDGAKDLNNDGTKELIINLNDLGGSVLWIYTWINDSLNPINPIIPTDDPSGVTFDSDSQFIDIDNDGIIEASLIYEKLTRLGPGPDDIRIDAYKRIYKWDGTEKPYYLWKEEKIGEEKL